MEKEIQNASGNDVFRDTEFKDDSPLKTVERIKSILEENHIKTKETWYESGVPYCYSIRVGVVGTDFGVNGKGLSKELALASGYGELMERLQFGYIGSLGVQKKVVFTDSASQYKKMTVSEQLERNRHWYEALADRLFAHTGQRKTPEEILGRFADENGEVEVMPYFNITQNREEAFPVPLHALYATNGAAAGNSVEEALVQGISEIVERYHQLRIIHEGITMPDVPEEVLKKYTVAYNIITYVRSRGFRVSVKDASLGTKFPVLCAVFVSEKTGKYHTHFGACPVFEIALERALTESFQGRSIENIAQFEQFHYKKKDAGAIDTIVEELRVGSAEKLVEFFVGEPQYPFNESAGFTGRNNKELLRECVDYFRDLGFDIMVRDRSSLGFPAMQVLVPGYSESMIHRLCADADDSTQQPCAVRVLRNPSNATAQEHRMFCEYIRLQKEHGRLERGPMAFRHTALLSASIPGALDEQLMLGSLGYVYYAVGEYEEVIDCIQKMLRSCTGRSLEYLICLKRWLSMKLHGYTQEQIRECLTFFHRPETCRKLYDCAEKGGNPLVEYTIRCDGICTRECPLTGLCTQKNSVKLSEMILHKISQMDFADTVQKLQNAIS